MFRNRLAALAALAALCASSAAARPFTPEDLLRQESFGQSAVDPTGRWLVLERRDPYLTAPRFDQGHQAVLMLNRLLVVDLGRPGPARPLLAASEGRGHSLAGFSPDGTRLAVTRLRGDRYDLGVVTLATGQVRWFDITPDASFDGATAQWASDTELLVIHRPGRDLPWPFRVERVFAETLPELWAARARGETRVLAVGSGAYGGLRPRPAPRELVRLDVSTGARRVLARGELVDLEVSPDGRRVALHWAAEDLPMHAGRPLHGDWGVATQAQRLSILDLRTGRSLRPCPDCDILPSLVSWSPDSAEFLIYARGADQPWSAGRLRRIDAATGQAMIIGDTLRPLVRGRPEIVRGGWMGRDPVVLARPAAGGPDARPDWWRLGPDGPVNLTRQLSQAPLTLAALERRGAVALEDGVAWGLDPQGRARRLACRNVRDARARGPMDVGRAWFAQRHASWLFADCQGRRNLARVSLDGLAPLAEAPADARSIAAGSPSGEAAVLATRDAHGVARLLLLRRGAAPAELAAVNRFLADTDAPQVHRIEHVGASGQPISSWLFLPPRPPGSPAPPLVIQPYSGRVHATPPRLSEPPLGMVMDVRPILGRGYAVLVPSLPRVVRGEPMAGLADAILAPVEAARQAPGLADAFDPNRLALWGHSFGGYTALAAVSQSHRFRAAVSTSAPFDLFRAWGRQTPYYRLMPEEGTGYPWSSAWVESVQGETGAPPWADPQRYVRNSPLFAADRIDTPVLLLHGELDTTLLDQSEAMFGALLRQDKDAVFVTYWGETHSLNAPGTVRDVFARALAFLDEHLRFTGPVQDERGDPAKVAKGRGRGRVP